MEENKALIEISRGQLALEKASDIHEIIDLRDKAMAYQILANARQFKEAAQDGKIYLDRKEITPDQLIKFLQFKELT